MNRLSQENKPIGRSQTASTAFGLLEELRLTISSLEDKIETLSDRLSPYRNQLAADQSPREPDRNYPPYFEQLHDLTQRLAVVSCRVSNITDTLEL